MRVWLIQEDAIDLLQASLLYHVCMHLCLILLCDRVLISIGLQMLFIRLELYLILSMDVLVWWKPVFKVECGRSGFVLLHPVLAIQ